MIKKQFLIFTAAILIVLGNYFISCKKDFSRQPVVSTGDFDLAMAIAHGTLVDIGTKEILDHGFCWDLFKKPEARS